MDIIRFKTFSSGLRLEQEFRTALPQQYCIFCPKAPVRDMAPVAVDKI
jgi:hypothetical protein